MLSLTLTFTGATLDFIPMLIPLNDVLVCLKTVALCAFFSSQGKSL